MFRFVRNEDSLCLQCWSNVLAGTRGWRRALFYLPLSCILAWRPNRLWLSYVAGKDAGSLSNSSVFWQMYVFAAGLLAVLSLLHIASSALGRRDPCQSNVDSVGESLLNSRQENYDRFEEVLVSIRKIGENLSRSSRLNFISYLSVYFFRNIDSSYTHFFSIASIIIVCFARWRRSSMTACQDQDAVRETATARCDTSDGPPGPAKPTRIASLNRGRVKSPRCLSPWWWTGGILDSISSRIKGSQSNTRFCLRQEREREKWARPK